MEYRQVRRGWVLAAALASASVANAESPHGAPGDAAIGAATRAIIEHAATRRLILLGESHGTREIPDLVHALAAGYVRLEPVIVALEMPHGEQASLDAYLRSDGGMDARAILRARTFWTRRDDQHDGRRSEDMLDLIEDVRRLRMEGHDVALLAYDMNPDTPRIDRDARDRFMARVIRTAYGSLPHGRVLVLGGNVHAMLERPLHAPPQMQTPMGAHLRDLLPVSVRIGAGRGQSWACIGSRRCGPVAADRSPRKTGPHPMPHTFGVMLERFTVARLIGAPPATN